jgi:hypothetical protein
LRSIITMSRSFSLATVSPQQIFSRLRHSYRNVNPWRAVYWLILLWRHHGSIMAITYLTCRQHKNIIIKTRRSHDPFRLSTAVDKLGISRFMIWL